MTRERKALIAGVGVLIFTVIAHNNNEPVPEWLMVMNAETREFQDTGVGLLALTKYFRSPPVNFGSNSSAVTATLRSELLIPFPQIPDGLSIAVTFVLKNACFTVQGG